MENKSCIKCGESKSLTDFYAHKGMADGHLNKCKSCCTNYQKVRREVLLEDKDWVEKERKRGRDKHFRLNYKSTATAESRMQWKNAHYAKYPEKRKARRMAENLPTVEGFHGHHWSYNEEHAQDLIYLTLADHKKLHRYMIYDQERKMYRNLDGVLLDTKERHTEYFEEIKHLD